MRNNKTDVCAPALLFLCASALLYFCVPLQCKLCMALHSYSCVCGSGVTALVIVIPRISQVVGGFNLGKG